MELSNGIILLGSGIFLLIISMIFLIFFLRGGKKNSSLLIEELMEKKDTAILSHSNKEQGIDETEYMEEDTQTILLEDDKTEMINS